MTGFIGGSLQQIFQGPPDALPGVPPEREKPALSATPANPGNMPGIGDTSTGAGAANERRRILKTMPQSTEKVFAGNNPGEAPIKKRRLLGSAVDGRITTGE